MNLLASIAIAVTVMFFAPSLSAVERSTSHAHQKFEFSHFLREHPLDLGQLLGKHITEVAPGTAWDSLSIPEEYGNPAIRYEVFARKDLHQYMKAWDFLTDEYCVSSYSMFLLFFNRGFVFKAELRYLPDSYSGSISPDDPHYCADETPIFQMIAKELGGTVVRRGNSEELVRYTSNSVMVLGAGGGMAGLSWNLRGGPSSRGF
jgi:hypothetical protein